MYKKRKSFKHSEAANLYFSIVNKSRFTRPLCAFLADFTRRRGWRVRSAEAVCAGCRTCRGCSLRAARRWTLPVSHTHITHRHSCARHYNAKHQSATGFCVEETLLGCLNVAFCPPPLWNFRFSDWIMWFCALSFAATIRSLSNYLNKLKYLSK